MPVDLANYVLRRAQRSIYLLGGLQDAFEDLDRPELMAMLDLVRKDAIEAKTAAKAFLAAQAQRRCLLTLADLNCLARGDEHAGRLARRIARRMGN